MLTIWEKNKKYTYCTYDKRIKHWFKTSIKCQRLLESVDAQHSLNDLRRRLQRLHIELPRAKISHSNTRSALIQFSIQFYSVTCELQSYVLVIVSHKRPVWVLIHQRTQHVPSWEMQWKSTFWSFEWSRIQACRLYSTNIKTCRNSQYHLV